MRFNELAINYNVFTIFFNIPIFTTIYLSYLNNSDLLVEVLIFSFLEQMYGTGSTGTCETFGVGGYCGHFRTLPIKRTLAVLRYVHPALSLFKFFKLFC